jgi:pimeloyl-ACP methyl ester carboxylesterase
VTRVLLLHGYGADRSMWDATGWTRALERVGLDHTAIDLPGHGAAAKPHEPAAYEKPRLLEWLLGVLGDEPADVIGYSLGGELALELALAEPARVRRLIAGGIGPVAPATHADAYALWDAVVAGDGAAAGPARDLWSQACGSNGNDPVALAAMLAGVTRGPRFADPARLAGSGLLFAGADDPIAAGVEDLAARLPGAELLLLPGRNHLTAATAAAAKSRALELLTSTRSER